MPLGVTERKRTRNRESARRSRARRRKYVATLEAEVKRLTEKTVHAPLIANKIPCRGDDCPNRAALEQTQQLVNELRQQNAEMVRRLHEVLMLRVDTLTKPKSRPGSGTVSPINVAPPHSPVHAFRVGGVDVPLYAGQ